MIAQAYVSHRIKNRLRVHVPSERKKPDFFARAEEVLRLLPDVDDVESNPVTASILIFHSGKRKPVLDHAKAHGLFKVMRRKETTAGRPGPWPRKVFHHLNRADNKLKDGTQGVWDLPTVTATGLLGLSFMQMMRMEIFPPAWTLLGDAFKIMIKSHEEAANVGRLLKEKT